MKHVVLLLLCALIFSCRDKPKETYDLVIKNGNVINIESGEIEIQNIFINDNRIVKLTDTSDKVYFSTEKSIDATGKYILPGFWDNHVHFRGGDSLISANKNFLKLFIANGITTVRDAGGDLTSSVLQWKEQISKGTLTGPTIFTSGPKLDGPNATWAGSLVVENEMDIKNALDSLKKLKTDFVKIYESRISREAYLETVTEATKRGLITSGHMPFSVELSENIEAGIGAIEHLYYVLKGCSSQEKKITEAIINKEYGFWQSMDKLIDSYNEQKANETFQLLKENNVFVVPTLHIGNVLSYLDEVDHENDAYLKIMPQGIINTYQRRINGALNSSEKAREDRKKLDSLFQKLTKLLFDADVKLLSGSDCGAFNSYIYPGFSLHKELEVMVSSGITPLGALQTSAYHGAALLKHDADYGRISVGKVADLVVLNENPLNDIKNTRSIHRVIKSGKVFDPKSIAEEIDCLECIIQ